MKGNIKTLIPTIYTPDCPTIRSRLYPLCRILAAKGFDFTFLVHEKEVKEVYPGIIYKGYKNHWELIYIVSKLNKKDADIILACKPHSVTGLLSFFVSRLKKIGYMLDVDDRITFSSEVNRWFRWILYLQERISERFLIMVKPKTVVASSGLQDYWGKHVHYIPNSVDLNFFDRGKYPDKVREKYKIAGQIVIWPAIFFHEIDQGYIIEIFKQIEDKRKNIFLLILGDGKYLPRIKAKAERLGLTNIVFLGRVDYAQMPFFYAAADAGIIPLRDNNFDACKGPIKLYEFMAMELPVIATPIGEPKEMIGKADCGVFIPFRDAEKAADVIIKLMDSKEELQRLGRNGRAYLECYQTLEKQAERLAEVLLSALKKG